MMESLVSLFGNTADACFAVDGRQRIVLWNPGARELFGLDEAEALGRRCYQVVAGRDLDGSVSCRRQCLTVREIHGGYLVPSQDIVVGHHRNRLRVNISTVVMPRNSGEAIPWLVHYFRPTKTASLSPSSHGNGSSNGNEQQAEMLTHRERQVLALLAQGATTEAVAEHLFISTTTARNHVQHILSKLAAHSRLEAVLAAVDHQLLTPPS